MEGVLFLKVENEWIRRYFVCNESKLLSFKMIDEENKEKNSDLTFTLFPETRIKETGIISEFEIVNYSEDLNENFASKWRLKAINAKNKTEWMKFLTSVKFNAPKVVLKASFENDNILGRTFKDIRISNEELLQKEDLMETLFDEEENPSSSSGFIIQITYNNNTKKLLFNRNTTCYEVLENFISMASEEEGIEDKYGIYYENQNKELVLLDPERQLKDYENVLNQNPRYYLKLRSPNEISIIKGDLVPEKTLIVLISHNRFMTSLELLSNLIEKHFQYGLELDDDDSQEKRTKIEKTITYWLVLFPSDFADIDMKVLLSSWKGASQVIRKFKSNPSPKPIPLPPEFIIPESSYIQLKSLAKSGKITDEVILKILADSPSFLALQLTAVDFHILNLISKNDLLRFCQKARTIDSSLKVIREDFNRTVQWMATLIAGQVEKKNAVYILERFVMLANYFLKLNNINGLMKVYTTLTLPFIARIFVFCFKKFKPEIGNMWDFVEREVEGHNRVAFELFFTRKYTANLKQDQPYIPCFFLLLQQLENIENNWKQGKGAQLTVTSSNYGSINFKKVTILSQVISDILSHNIMYDFEIEPELQRFFKEENHYKSNNELAEILSSTNEGAEGSKIKSNQVHSWAKKNFLRIQKCTHCNKSLLFIHQGFQCKVCGLIGHEQCLLKIDKKYTCKAELVSLLDVSREITTFTQRFFSKNNYCFGKSETISAPLLNQLENFVLTQQVDKIIQTLELAKISLAFTFSDGQNLFHLAALWNSMNLLDFIHKSTEEKPDIDQFDKNGWTALHVACFEGNLKIVNALLHFGPKLNRPNPTGATPLSYLVRKTSENEAYYRSLLIRMINDGANVNAPDKNEWMPLHHAVNHGNLIAAEILLSLGAFVDPTNSENLTPMDIAKEKKNMAMIRVLESEKKPQKFSKQLIVLNDGDWTIDNGDSLIDYSSECLNLTTELLNGAHFSNYFFDKVHVDMFGSDPTYGNVIISLLKEDRAGRILIRSREGDQIMVLPELISNEKLLKNLKDLSGIEFRVIEDEEIFNNLIKKAEATMTNVKFHFDLLYVKAGQHILHHMLQNDEDSHSSAFEEFLDFLGSKEFTQFQIGTELIEELGVCTKFKGVELVFSVTTLQKQKKIGKRGVTLIFSEASSFDLSIFSSLDTNIVIIIQMEKNFRNESFYLMTVCFRNDIHPCSPFLPYLFRFPKNKQFHTFFLTKLINCWIRGKTIDGKQKEIAHRSKQLEELVNKLKSEKKSKKSGQNEKYKDYELDQELGKGATSSVYKARDINTGNIFAVKLVYKTRIENEEMLAAVKGEINLMNKCNHQNIVKAYDMFDLPDQLFIVLEICDGGSIEEDVRKHAYLEKKAASVGYQMLDAVTYLHKKFISHRDLKPPNIMYSSPKKDSIKIIDFGFGKDVSGGKLNHTIVGTRHYMAPEIMNDEYDYYKIDVFSCGCIIYFLLFQKPPLKGAKNIIIPSNASLSPAAKKFLLNLCNFDYTARYSGAQAVEDPWFDILNQKS